MEPAVQVKGLVKVYEGNVRALDGVDLTIEAGKVFSLLGPNGAGKTTLVRILTTQLRPTSGEARVFDLNVIKDGDKVRRLVSYVPQEMSVWTDISGYENLLIYAKIFGIPSEDRRKVIWDVLEIMGVGDAANKLVRTYSGGMIRRLEIACAMLIKPKIMFLDEPTIGLDPSARKIVWEELTSFKKEYGATVFFNTHYMDEADLFSDEIAIIDRGKIVAYGTATELKHSVGGDVIQFTLDSHVLADDVVSRIRGSGLVTDVIVDSGGFSAIVGDAETALPEIIELLRKEEVSIRRISMTHPTLDDVFLKYAGSRLEAHGRITEVTQVRGMIRRA